MPARSVAWSMPDTTYQHRNIIIRYQARAVRTLVGILVGLLLHTAHLAAASGLTSAASGAFGATAAADLILDLVDESGHDC